MAKSPLGRVELLAELLNADPEVVISLILGTESTEPNPWFEAEIGKQPLDEEFARKMRRVFSKRGVHFDLKIFRPWVTEAINEPDDIMERLVRKLKSEGVSVALLTNAVPEFWPVIETTINVELFDVVVDSSKVGLRKPDKRIYELTASLLNVDVNQCLMIDDLEHNVTGAKNAGMEGLLFVDSNLVESEVLKYFSFS